MFGKFEALLAMIVLILVAATDQRFSEFARKVSEKARAIVSRRKEAS